MPWPEMAVEGIIMAKQDIKDEHDRLLSAYLEDCQLQNMSPESIRRYRSSLLIYLHSLERSNLRAVEADIEALRAFLRYLQRTRQVKFKTIENYFSSLSSFYDYLTFEGITQVNIVLPFRKRYLKRYKKENEKSTRQLLSVEQLAEMLSIMFNPRDRAMILLLAKTGIRRNELLKVDNNDINWVDGSINLKPTPKRSNRLVYFDDEVARALKRWIKLREKLESNTDALFISYQTGTRLSRNAVWKAVVTPAIQLGFHNPDSKKLEDHIGPHCMRHWFTTHLIRNGMPREYVKELRGDRRAEAIDIYHHIDEDELRQAYLAYIPKLGI